MKIVKFSAGINKKIVAPIIMLLICMAASVMVNFKSSGAFMNSDKTEKKLPIYRVDTKGKRIAITFDTTWGENNTVRLLDILDKYHVKATFFVLGKWVDEFPNETKEIAKRGHEIGNHSDKHPNMTSISKDKMMTEIASADAKIMAVTGKKPELFRCPEGAYNDSVVNTVELTNHECIQWDVDSIDWRQQGANIEYSRVIKKVKPGSIILFHNAAKYTPENIPRIIEKLKAEGYEFVTVSELIYKDDYYIDNNGNQIKN